MKDQEHLLNRIFKLLSRPTSSLYLFIADVDHNTSLWSQAAADYFGFPTTKIENSRDAVLGVIHPDDRNMLADRLTAIATGISNTLDVECRAKNKDGNYIWVRCHAFAEDRDEGDHPLFVGTVQNLGLMPKFDPTTGFAGDSALRSHLKKRIADGREGTLMLFDFDRFRNVNDMIGHMKCDELLRRFGEKCLAIPDTNFFRLTGDHFLCHFDGTDTERASKLFARVQQSLTEVSRTFMNGATVTVSCGSACYPKDGTTDEELYTNLEYAAADAKNHSRGSHMVYSSHQHGQDMAEFRLQQDLLNAVTNNFEGFSLAFQPIVSPTDCVTHGCEVLLRFKTPAGINVSPEVFVRILEREGLIARVGTWVLRQALRQAAGWIKPKERFSISVNVSYLQMIENDFCENVISAVKESGFPPENLILELTESCRATQLELISERITELAKHGISLALDDFGTGYSSIALLRVLKPRWIKIDHTFVRSIEESPMDQSILEYISGLCHTAGIKVCVEGIENQGILNFVKPFNAEALQGYHFSKPCTAEFFERDFLLRKAGSA